MPQPIFTEVTLGPSISIPGLECLNPINRLAVTQTYTPVATSNGLKDQIIYDITSSLDESLFFGIVDETPGAYCFRTTVPFNARFFNPQWQEIFQISRPYRSNCCWCCCNLQELDIRSSSGIVIGSVQQNGSLLYTNLSVKNEVGETMLKIQNSLMHKLYSSDIRFNIMNLDGKQVGSIKRKCTVETKRECFEETEITTYSNSVPISFPLGLDVKLKAALIGASFLIVSAY